MSHFSIWLVMIITYSRPILDPLLPPAPGSIFLLFLQYLSLTETDALWRNSVKVDLSGLVNGRPVKTVKTPPSITPFKKMDNKTFIRNQ